jgi:integrase
MHLSGQALEWCYRVINDSKPGLRERVGRILGHVNIGVTADIYRHVKTGEMHEEHIRFAPMNTASA